MKASVLLDLIRYMAEEYGDPDVKIRVETSDSHEFNEPTIFYYEDDGCFLVIH